MATPAPVPSLPFEWQYASSAEGPLSKVRSDWFGSVRSKQVAALAVGRCPSGRAPNCLPQGKLV